ncbi:MAG: VUT family protein [Flavobacteriales bacterium]|nr:MAG: VUT family protein [Flavobacteriales bacterium]|tara:strand:+ start:4617 stop:5321 length:705 start_codon:yes stop_codon:yes gene_type:complete
MKPNQISLANKIYLILAGLFITSLVASNLIFTKIFYWYPFDINLMGVKLFELSVGILPYPLTFLITDLISEIYGQKKADQVVITGIFASIFSIGLIFISSQVPAIEGSPIDDATFNSVFLNAPLAVLASMLTYLFAQFVDIRIYHFWKRLTKGKHLWLRNNFSTFTSQFIDTFTIVSLLIVFGILPQDKFLVLIVSGFLFKVMVAILDTPLLYLCVWIFRKKFNLKVGEEIKLT